MRFLPYERFEIDVDEPPQTVVKRLAKSTAAPPLFSFFGPQKTIQGWVRFDSFEVEGFFFHERTNVRVVLIGRIEKSPTGTKILVTARTYWSNFLVLFALPVFLIFSLSQVLLWFFGRQIVEEPFSLLAFSSLFTVGVWAIIVSGFHARLADSRTWLEWEVKDKFNKKKR